MIKVKLDIFPLTFFVLRDKKDFKKLKKEYKINIKFNDSDYIYGLCFNYNCYQIIYLKSNDIPILIHELSHAVHNGINFIGENSNSETFAYMMQFLTQEILKKLTEY